MTLNFYKIRYDFIYLLIIFYLFLVRQIGRDTSIIPRLSDWSISDVIGRFVDDTYDVPDGLLHTTIGGLAPTSSQCRRNDEIYKPQITRHIGG